MRTWLYILLFLCSGSAVTGQETFSLTEARTFPNTGTISFVASPDGAWLAAANHTSIQIWRRSADGYVLGELISGFNEENPTISLLCPSYDGNLLMAVGKDSRIYVFRRSAASFSLSQTLSFDFIPSFLSFSADGNYFAASSPDNKCTIWKVSGTSLAKVSTLPNTPALLFSPADAGIAYSGGKMYKFSGGVLSGGKNLPAGETYLPDEFSFSPDGNYFAALYFNDYDNIYLWKKQADGSFKQTSRVEQQKWGTRFLEFSPDSKHIIVYNRRPADKKQRFVALRIDGGALSFAGEFGGYSQEMLGFQFVSDGKYAFGASARDVIMYHASGTSGNKRFNINLPVAPLPNTHVNSIPNTVVIERPDTTAKNPEVINIINIFWVSPDPEILNDKPIVSEKDAIEIQIKVVSGKKTTKDEIKIIINGKEMQKTKSGSASIKESQQDKLYEYTYINTIPLEQTADNINTIEVLVNGKKTSKPLKVLYSSAKPNLHVLAIGTSLDLEFPKKDAGDFADLFRAQAGNDLLFGSVNVRTLIGKDATTTGIKESIERFRYDFSTGAIGPKDVLLIFISSHGFIYQDQLRIQGDDYKDMFKETYSVAYNEIISRLKEVNCKKLIFLDACFSGGAKASVTDVNNAIKDLNKQSQGVTTFSSSSNDEFSYEDKKWQNGAFTYAIKEALKDGKADADKNGIVTIGELYIYVSKRVPDIVTEVKGKSQHPSMPVTDLLNNTAIYIIGK